MSAAVPFADGEELGSAWHGLIGTGDHELDGSLVEKKLKENPQFLRRVVATMGDGDDSIFFGPAKVLLSAVAKRLSSGYRGYPRPWISWISWIPLRAVLCPPNSVSRGATTFDCWT